MTEQELLDLENSAGDWSLLTVEEVKKIVAYIRELQKVIKDTGIYLDNPDFDGTDAAHPAWWRGHFDGSDGTCFNLMKILLEEGEEMPKDWKYEALRTRILALKEKSRVGPI